MEEVTQQLRAKGRSLEEAESRCVQERERMEGEKAILTGQLGVATGQLGVAKDELEKTKRLMQEVMKPYIIMMS